MNVASYLIWSIVATVVMTVFMAAPQRLGMTRISLPMILGMIFVRSHDRALAVGLLVHGLAGLLFAGVYVGAFEQLGRADPWVGLLGGTLHGLFTLLVILPALPGIHPRMASNAQGPDPTRGLEPPGFLGFNYGRPTAGVTFVAHLVYGAVLGGFYQLA